MSISLFDLIENNPDYKKVNRGRSTSRSFEGRGDKAIRVEHDGQFSHWECPHCGEWLDINEDRFCRKCGEKVKL